MIRLMLILAALAYGAMPLTGMAATMADVTASPISKAAPHSGHMAAPAGDQQAHHEAMAPEGDCPHPGKTMTTGHCAACLTLAADILIADAGQPARSALCPAHIATLTSRIAPPLDPPPRS